MINQRKFFLRKKDAEDFLYGEWAETRTPPRRRKNFMVLRSNQPPSNLTEMIKSGIIR